MGLQVAQRTIPKSQSLSLLCLFIRIPVRIKNNARQFQKREAVMKREREKKRQESQKS